MAITHAISSTSNAVDVDSTKDWLDMYQDIAVALPKKIKILVDLKTVKQLCHLNVSILCPMSRATISNSSDSMTVRLMTRIRVTQKMKKSVVSHLYSFAS